MSRDVSEMQLTFYTDYALRVLIYLNKMPNKVSTITEISEFYQISKNHLVKVVHSLAQLGYVASIRGKGGGIKLAKPSHEISIGEIVRKMEPNFYLVECFNSGTNRCVITQVCRLRGILSQGIEAFFKVLDSYALSDGSQLSLAEQITTHLDANRILSLNKVKSLKS